MPTHLCKLIIIQTAAVIVAKSCLPVLRGDLSHIANLSFSGRLCVAAALISELTN